MTRAEIRTDCLRIPTVEDNFFFMNAQWVEVKSNVGRSTRKCHEVILGIIRLNFIYVMNYFIRFEISTNSFFNNKSMFKDVSRIRRWVTFDLFDKVTKAVFINTAAPVVVITPYKTTVTRAKLRFYEFTRLALFQNAHFFNSFRIMLFSIKRIIFSFELTLIGNCFAGMRTMLSMTTNFYRTNFTDKFNHEVII